MNEKVVISIKGLQSVDEEKDCLEFMTQGKYFLKNNKHYISYEESDEEGNITKSRVKAYDKCVEVTRKGGINNKMTFVEGKTYQSLYSTFVGELLMEVKTDKVVVEENENQLLIDVKYELIINNVQSSVNNITIKVANVAE